MAQDIEGHLHSPPGRFAICVSRFNQAITERLSAGALDTLRRSGVAEADIDVIHCPGALELLAVVRRASESKRYAGVIALGAVIRGGTPHFDHVASAVIGGLAHLSREAPCAVTCGVLTTDSAEHALDRAGLKHGNKGSEAALACIELVNLFRHMAK